MSFAPPLERSRITERIRAAMRAPLTLVAAPPGYGKTTALRQAARTGGDLAVFHALRPYAEPLVGFSQSLTAALAAGLGVAVPAFALGASAPAAAEVAYWLELMLESRSATLALDDVHHIVHDERAVRWLTDIIARTRKDVTWIVATRVLGQLPVDTWHEDGLLGGTIGGDELVFDRRELQALLEQRTDQAGDAQLTIERIEKMTHGWPAATTLAVGCLRVAPLAIFEHKTQDLLYQYLAQQAFANLDEATQRFLLATCLLPHVSDEAGAALAGDTGRLAADVRAALPFVVESEGGFRYHDLYRGFLCAELQRSPLADYASTLRRTARWLCAHSDVLNVTAGVELFLEAGALDELAAVLPGIWRLLMRRGYIGLLARCAVRSDPFEPAVSHTIKARIAAFLHGDHTAALDHVERALCELSGASAGTQCDVLFSLARFIEEGSFYQRIYRPYFEACQRYVEHCARWENPSHEELMLATTLVAGSTSGRYLCEVGWVVHRLRAVSADEGLPPPTRFAAMVRCAYTGLLTNDRSIAGNMRDALAYAQAAGIDLECSHYNYLYMVEHFGFDDFARAKGALQDMCARAAREGWARMQRQALADLASLAVEAGDETEYRRIELSVRTLSHAESSHLGEYILQQQWPWLAAWSGDFAQAYALQMKNEPPAFFPETRWQWIGEGALFAACAGKTEEALAHLKVISSEVLPALADPKWWHPTTLGALHAVLAYLRLQRRAPAQALLRALEARSTTLPPRFLAMLRAVQAIARGTDLAAPLDDLRALDAGGFARLFSLVHENLTVPAVKLSPAEREVLRLMSRGLTSKEIGAELKRSHETVNKQVASIVRKLGARGRREALTLAANAGYL